MGQALFNQLTQEDQKLAMSSDGAPIDFSTYPHIFSQAIKWVLSIQPHAFGPASARAKSTPNALYNNRKQLLLRWFVRFREGGSFEDLPRKKKCGLTEYDWQLLKEFLVHEDKRYLDVHGNLRRHPSLAHAYVYLEKTDPLDLLTTRDREKEMGILNDALAVSRVEKFTTLTEMVVAKFKLHARMEKFKPRRNCSDAQVAAQRYDAQIPMAEYHYTGQGVEHKRDGSIKDPQPYRVLTWRQEKPELQGVGDGEKYSYSPLYFDSGAHHITAAIDGCSVFLKGGVQYDAHSVFYDVRSCLQTFKCRSVLQHSLVHELRCAAHRGFGMPSLQCLLDVHNANAL